MAHTPAPPDDTVTTRVRLASPTWEIDTTVTVPAGPTRLRDLLPLVQSFADAAIGAAVEVAQCQGKTITCKAGCGACCRQLVPIAEAEARRIRDLVESLPEPRRSHVRARFAAARERLAAAGLLDKLLHPEQWDAEDNQHLADRYFSLGIACPFLENESCSIHPERPIVCREYLVTTPAAHCAQPTPENIRRVPLPFQVWTAVARFDPVPDDAEYLRWVPLVVAPEWAEAHPDEPPPRPGLDLLRELFDHLTGNEQPVTEDAARSLGAVRT